MDENIPNNLEQDIKQLIASITGLRIEELKPDANFWKDLGVDSIKTIEITVAIERQYGVRIRDEQIPQISTVGHAIEVIKEALKKKTK